MIHPSWDKLFDLIDQIESRFGWSIYDPRAGKSWDCGQAVCAELYGPSWSESPAYQQVALQSDADPVSEEAIAAAERLLAGECDWAEGREP